MNQPPTFARRHMLAGIAALTAASTNAHAGAPAAPASKQSGAEGTTHKIVYQLNQADDAYQNAIFNSISALLTKYVDDISIAVVVWGPGIHLLAKNPKRPVPKLYQQRVRSMAESYGVKFIACGNTMHTVGWTQADMLEFAQVEDVGAAAVMELQGKGYAYLAW
jgi:intracellular sulfur oxidation DsrE/DsrF family protein